VSGGFGCVVPTMPQSETETWWAQPILGDSKSQLRSDLRQLRVSREAAIVIECFRTQSLLFAPPEEKHSPVASLGCKVIFIKVRLFGSWAARCVK